MEIDPINKRYKTAKDGISVYVLPKKNSSISGRTGDQWPVTYKFQLNGEETTERASIEGKNSWNSDFDLVEIE